MNMARNRQELRSTANSHTNIVVAVMYSVSYPICDIVNVLFSASISRDF